MTVSTALGGSSALPETARPDNKYRPRLPPDATERLKAELSKSLRRSARQAYVMKVTGHDLRQPLHVLSMLFDTLALQPGHSDATAHIALAHRAIRRMAEGLDQLALASRPGPDTERSQPRLFPVAEVLRQIEPTWSAHALEKQVRLHVMPSSAWIRSDSSMLRTILDNLIGNAIKYSTQGRVVVGCRLKGDLLSIRVIDQGIGISADALRNIFTAFHQEDPSSSGMGLGLSIVQLAAAALGHRIRVESRLGRGSIFSVDIPRVGTPAIPSGVHYSSDGAGPP